MNVWMKIEKDKYELPVAVANTAQELANICGTNVHSVMSIVSKTKKGIIKKPTYIKVEIEEE
ncbi:MAG: hypothetical protein E7254_02535 [Lachnospiraceae bacterium]|nr:hypothetical protein [Lachnospiraceae bacterium]